VLVRPLQASQLQPVLAVVAITQAGQLQVQPFDLLVMALDLVTAVDWTTPRENAVENAEYC